MADYHCIGLFAKLEFLYFEFVAVHVTNGEIHVVFHLELTLNLSLYC